MVLWEHYTKVVGSRDSATCNHCGAVLSCKDASTSNLSRHLERVHAVANEERKRKEADESEARTQARDAVFRDPAVVAAGPAVASPSATAGRGRAKRAGPKYAADDVRQVVGERKLAEWLALESQPFTTINAKSFKAMFAQLDPRFTLRSSSTFRKDRVPRLYEELKVEVESVLEQETASLDGICFTTDLWTSRNSDAYQALTCHYINEDFILRKWLVSCTPFAGRHTGQLISDRLDPEIRKLNLRPSCHRWCVNDHGSNIIVAVRNMVEVNTEYFCNDHTIDLAVRQAVRDCAAFAEVVEKCKSLATYLHRSTLSVSLCREKAASLGERYTKVLQVVSTRWNSEFYAFQSILSNRATLEALWTDGCGFADRIPSPVEWQVLEACLPLLAPFAKASSVLSSDSVPTVHEVLLSIGNIRYLLKQPQTDDVARELAGKLLEQLDRRFPEQAGSVIENAIANLLDPRYKGVQLRELERFDEAKAALETMYRDTLDESAAEHRLDQANQAASSSGSSTSDEELDYNEQLLRKYMGDQPTVSVERRKSEVGLSQELDLYLTTKCCKKETPILGWWRLNAATFPILSRLARKV